MESFSDDLTCIGNKDKCCRFILTDKVSQLHCLGTVQCCQNNIFILITIAGFFVFDIKTGLYSLLGLTVRSFMVDSFIESLNLSKYFNVVCDHPEVICDFIVHTLNRSASVCHARGAYSGQDKYIILTALNRALAVQLRNFILS